MTTLAIIGLGSWGLCALERLVSAARVSQSSRISSVDVIEPGPPGSGVYRRGQPDYLIMNNPCGQLSLYPDCDTHDRPPYARGLYEWACQAGYRWVGDECVRDQRGRPITPHDFLPRRLMGEYLEWFYTVLVSAAPTGLEIRHHATAALDVRPAPCNREEVFLADGSSLTVDHVILTSGHTPNASIGARPRHLDPYPIDAYVDSLASGSSVGIAGMGLVAADVVTALTVGRGGRFAPDGARLRYKPNGREPIIHLFSRSGLPYCAKAVAGVDATGEYEPLICTPGALSSVRRSGRRVDMRADILPLIFAEMKVRFYVQHALLSGGPVEGDAVRRSLLDGWNSGNADLAWAPMAAKYGDFDAAAHFFGPSLTGCTSGKDYEAVVYDLVASDLDASLVEGGASPVKCAYEVLRVLRDTTRSVVEFGGLTLPSYVDFHRTIRNRIHRLVAGPPALRSQQLLALVDAGVVRLQLGPSPVAEARAKGFDLCSTVVRRPRRVTVDHVIRAHLDDPTVYRSASPLLANLYRSGRIQQFHYGDAPVGSIDLTTEFHPVNAQGAAEPRIWVFGVLTEGIRYFNQYVPSPRSRVRAVLDMQTCLDTIAA